MMLGAFRSPAALSQPPSQQVTGQMLTPRSSLAHVAATTPTATGMFSTPGQPGAKVVSWVPPPSPLQHAAKVVSWAPASSANSSAAFTMTSPGTAVHPFGVHLAQAGAAAAVAAKASQMPAGSATLSSPAGSVQISGGSMKLGQQFNKVIHSDHPAQTQFIGPCASGSSVASTAAGSTRGTATVPAETPSSAAFSQWMPTPGGSPAVPAREITGPVQSGASSSVPPHQYGSAKLVALSMPAQAVAPPKGEDLTSSIATQPLYSPRSGLTASQQTVAGSTPRGALARARSQQAQVRRAISAGPRPMRMTSVVLEHPSQQQQQPHTPHHAARRASARQASPDATPKGQALVWSGAQAESSSQLQRRRQQQQQQKPATREGRPRSQSPKAESQERFVLSLCQEKRREDSRGRRFDTHTPRRGGGLAVEELAHGRLTPSQADAGFKMSLERKEERPSSSASGRPKTPGGAVRSAPGAGTPSRPIRKTEQVVEPGIASSRGRGQVRTAMFGDVGEDIRAASRSCSADVGLSVVSMASGQVLYSYMDRAPSVPASPSLRPRGRGAYTREAIDANGVSFPVFQEKALHPDEVLVGSTASIQPPPPTPRLRRGTVEEHVDAVGRWAIFGASPSNKAVSPTVSSGIFTQ